MSDVFYAALAAERLDEVIRLRAENENLRAALKPFAVEEQVIHRWYSSDVFPYVPDDHPVLSNKITVGDLRAAAAALKETE